MNRFDQGTRGFVLIYIKYRKYFEDNIAGGICSVLNAARLTH